MISLRVAIALSFVVAAWPARGENWAVDPTLTPAQQAERSAWYARQKVPGNLNQSCCGEADAYYADKAIVEGGQVWAIITDERTVPNRPYIKPGTRIPVPEEKNKDTREDPNETGHTIIFVRWYPEEGDAGNWYVFCYLSNGDV